jgi:Ca-activated chloride channel family protein
MKKLFAVAWIFILCSFTTINSTTGILSGLVVDSQNNAPVANAKLLVYQAKKKVAEGKSDVKGSFTFSLDAGSYTLEIVAKGYESHKMNVYVNAGKDTRVKPALNRIELKKETIEIVQMDEIVEMEFYEDVNIITDSRLTKTMAVGMAAPRSQYASGGDNIYVEHNTEEYDFINENGFKDALTNPLSTFSVDVDRASYSNIRRFLTQNQKPYKDAVRIEELINYFDYSYPQPADGHPFSVTIEGNKCPWNSDRQLVLIGLKGENVNEKEIPASNLVFLVDVSGSMSYDNKLPLLKQAFKYLVEQLRPQDKVAIVVYAGAAGLVLKSTPGSEKPKITAALDLLEAGGSTAGGAGIQLAYKVAKENFIHGGNNRVILATDGDFNVGVSSSSEMVRMIETKRDEGVFLTILGFGMGNYKDGRMEQLSNAGNGNYAYIDNILEAKKMFGTELWGTLYTIAKDVKIQVEFNPAKVKAYRLIGYENRILNKEDFNNDKKDAGDIGCGHTVTALYEIIPADSNEKVPATDDLIYSKQIVTNKNDLMTVKIRYKKPDEDVSKLITKTIEADKLPKSSNILFASSVAEFGMLLRDSEFKGTASFSALITRAKSSKGTDENGYKDDFIKLAQMAEMLYK